LWWDPLFFCLFSSLNSFSFPSSSKLQVFPGVRAVTFSPPPCSPSLNMFTFHVSPPAQTGWDGWEPSLKDYSVGSTWIWWVLGETYEIIDWIKEVADRMYNPPSPLDPPRQSLSCVPTMRSFHWSPTLWFQPDIVFL
jgi:hypothetical protein